MRLALMSLLLLVCGAVFAQTQVVFEAGVDKGSTNSNGNHHIDKEGITFGGDYANLANNPYRFNNVFSRTRHLTVTSNVGKIISVVIEGNNVGNITSVNLGAFDSSTGTWTGESDNISMSYSSAFTVAKVTVTVSGKKSLSLAYSKTEDAIYVDDKDKYVAPTLSAKYGDADVEGLNISYSSSATDVATVAANGDVTVHGVGDATITATVKDNATYSDATASYTLFVADPDSIFHETFDKYTGKGGGDGTFPGGDDESFDPTLCDNKGWYEKSTTGGTLQTVIAADKCLNLFGQAALISPDLKYLNGMALLTFKAAANRNCKLKITIDGKATSVNVPEGKFENYSVVIPNGTPSTHLEFWGETASFWGGINYNIFIDDVKVVKLVSFSDKTDNSVVVEANDDKSVNIMLERNLSNEYWNTLCLPFDMTEKQVSEIYGANTKIREFNRVENGALVFVKATDISAGKPCLIKPENSVAGSVMLRSTVKACLVPSVYVDNEHNEYRFVGIVSPTALEASDLFIGTDSNLYYPDMDTEGANVINGMRAYIQLPEGTDAKSLTMNLDGNEATEVSTARRASNAGNLVYTMSGQLVGKSLVNLKKGIYITKGKKIIIE